MVNWKPYGSVTSVTAELQKVHKRRQRPIFTPRRLQKACFEYVGVFSKAVQRKNA